MHPAMKDGQQKIALLIMMDEKTHKLPFYHKSLRQPAAAHSY